MRRRQLELFPTQDADALMAHVLQVMREETTAPIENPLPSLGGLLGGQAKAVHDAAPRLAAALMGETLTKACAYAMAVLERSFPGQRVRLYMNRSGEERVCALGGAVAPDTCRVMIQDGTGSFQALPCA